MTRKTILAVLCATAGLFGAVQAQETEHKYGFNPESFEVKFYIQPRYTYDFTEEEPLLVDTDHWFGVRRARIYLTSEVLPNLKGRVQFETRPTGFRGLDVYLDWKFAEIDRRRPLTLRVGQFKKPFSYQEFVMASNDLNMIDRTFTNGFLADIAASDRDQGAMLTADLWEYDVPGRIHVGLFNGNGPGQSIDDNDGKQLVARADFTPVTWLTVGGDLSINRLGSPADTTVATPPGDPYGAETAVVWGGEAVFARSGFQVVSEVFGGDNTLGIMDFRMTVPTFLGWYVEGIYRSPGGWEPGVRYESFDPDTDTDDDGANLYSAVLGWSLSRNFRWQVEYGITDYRDDREDQKILVSQWTVRL